MILKKILYFILFPNNILQFIFGITSGYYLEKNNVQIGIILLSLQFIFGGISLLLFGIINIYFIINFKNIIEKSKILENNVKTNVGAGIFNGIVWISQGLWIVINLKSYQKNILTFIISVIYNYLSLIIFNTCFIYMVLFKILII